MKSIPLPRSGGEYRWDGNELERTDAPAAPSADDVTQSASAQASKKKPAVPAAKKPPARKR